MQAALIPGPGAAQHVADLADVARHEQRDAVAREVARASSASISAAVTSTNGDGLGVEHDRVDVRVARPRRGSRARTWSALAKNRPASTRSTTTPGDRLAVGWRAPVDPACSAARSAPSTATFGRDAR